MTRKIMSDSQLSSDIKMHLRPSGDFYILTDLDEKLPRPSIIQLEGNLYYRFMNLLYLPQPPESLSPEKVIEICDLRLEHLNQLVDYKYNSRIVEAIADYLKSTFSEISSTTNKMKALDFGCGSGLSLQLMLKHFPHLNMVGVDISEKAVQFSQEQGLAAIRTYPDQPLPFQTASFDLVFAIFVMHFSIDIETLVELKRILRPTGKYVFNLFQRNIDGVEQQLLEAGFNKVEIIANLPEREINHFIVSCSNIQS